VNLAPETVSFIKASILLLAMVRYIWLYFFSELGSFLSRYFQCVALLYHLILQVRSRQKTPDTTISPAERWRSRQCEKRH